MKNLAVAAVNLKIQVGQIEANLNRIEEWVSKLSGKGAQVIGFPEMAVCGYDRSEAIIPCLEPVPGPATNHLVEIASRYDVLILAGMGTVKPGRQYQISQVAASPKGIKHIHHKVQLGTPERKLFTPGDDISVFEYHGWRIGMQICYETHYPEISTIQALQRADLLFMAFAAPSMGSTMGHGTQESNQRLKRYLPARAYDNSCYVISCNLTGRGLSGAEFCGGALALSPTGKIMGEVCHAEEDALLVELKAGDLEGLCNRHKGTFLSHRKHRLYQQIIQEVLLETDQHN